MVKLDWYDSNTAGGGPRGRGLGSIAAVYVALYTWIIPFIFILKKILFLDVVCVVH